LTVKERKVFTEEQRARDTYENIIHSHRQYGKAEGIEIGRAEGRDEGVIIGKMNSARQMLAKGFSAEVTADVLDIPITDVAKISSEMGRQ